MLLEGENQSNSKNQRHHIIFLAQEAENICGCRPWNIPSEDGSTMCWVVGSVCFHQVLSVFFFARFCLQKILIRLWKRSEARNWNLFAIARRIVSGEFAFCVLVSEVSLIFTRPLPGVESTSGNSVHLSVCHHFLFFSFSFRL